MLVGVLVGALAFLIGVANWHYALNTWLAWRYLWVGGLAVFWALSCLSCGTFLLAKLGVQLEDRATEAALAFPLGVVAFEVAMFLLGLAGLLNVVTFVLLPIAFALLGRHKVFDAVRTLRATIKPPSTFLQLGVVLFGAAGVAFLYFLILSPETIHWDARWYHLPIAQQYALSGAVRPSPERWWLIGYPHAASLLYAWAFLLPRALLFDRLELCLHMEFVVFLGTIASIPTLVRRLAPGVTARGAWAGIFLFPGIFLYDSNLCGAADHIAALLCIPIALTIIRVWRKWAVPEAVLFGTFIGAGLAAKYSAWSMLIFPGLLFLSRAVWLTGGRFTARDRAASVGRPAVLPPLLAGAGMMLLISAQHWLKNWIWYGDPLFPMLHDRFHIKPWSPEASASYRLFASFASPVPLNLDSVRNAFQAVFTFAFIPNDWPVYHRNVPVFGFLFTLTLFFLPFVRAGARLWLAYLGAMVSIIAWYLTVHQDRYLQAWLPVMVACTVAALSLVWNRRRLAMRALVAGLVGFQIIWGADIPFFPTHNLIHDSPIRLLTNFLASGFLRTPSRLRLYGDEGLVAERLPRDANLLVHETNMHIGYDARSVNDQWQSRLSYATLASPAEIYRELADLKITHVTWEAKLSGWNSLGNDLAFMGFALNYTLEPQVMGQLTLARFPPSSPPAPFNDRVAMLGCGTPYATGFYRIQNMIMPDPGQPWAAPEAPIPDAQVAVRDAGFMVVDPGCTPVLPPEVQTLFHPPISLVRGPLQLYIRRL